MSKTHSRHVTVTYDGNDITGSVRSINNIGVQHQEVDASTLASTLDEFIHGRGSLNLELQGPLNNAASQGHKTIEPLNGDADGATLLIQIGDGAAPTTGDPEFNADNIGVFNYQVQVPDNGLVTYSASLRPLDGATASWDTV